MAADLRATDLDVTSLHHRRATHRWERTSVGDLLERMTWSFPDQEAIVGREGAYADPAFRRLTYRQADQFANQIAHALLARGLDHGDVVMLFCENSVEGYLIKIGAAKAGLVVAPMNPMMAPDMISAMIRLVEPRLAVVDAEFWAAAEAPFAANGLEVGVTITLGGGPVPGSVSFSDFRARSAGHRTGRRDPRRRRLGSAVHLGHHRDAQGRDDLAHARLSGRLRFRGVPLRESEVVGGSFLPILSHVADKRFAFSVFLSGGTLILGRKPVPGRIAEMIA